MNGISALIKRTPESSLALFLPCMVPARGRPSMNQEVGSRQTMNLPTS